jgi:hypothetical protein
LRSVHASALSIFTIATVSLGSPDRILIGFAAGTVLFLEQVLHEIIFVLLLDEVQEFPHDWHLLEVKFVSERGEDQPSNEIVRLRPLHCYLLDLSKLVF